MEENKLKGIIEALLFASERPLKLEQIREVIEEEDVSLSAIQSQLEILKNEYQKGERSFQIEEIAGGFQFSTHPQYSPWLKKFFGKARLHRLSQAALETLAIAAYKQPVTRTEVEFIRGVNVDAVMEHLLEIGFLRIVGRKEAPGRPFLYGTTRLFLEHFRLKSLEELPKLEEFTEEMLRYEQGDADLILPKESKLKDQAQPEPPALPEAQENSAAISSGEAKSQS
jgi:segregation and condensation protein B